MTWRESNKLLDRPVGKLQGQAAVHVPDVVVKDAVEGQAERHDVTGCAGEL